MPYKDPEKKRAYARNYYLAHTEEILDRSNNYYLAHTEEVIKKVRNYTLAHIDEKREYWRNYAFIHSEKKRAITRNYLLAHPEHDRNYKHAHPEKNREQKRTRRARKLSASGRGIKANQWEQLKAEYNHCCGYCGNRKTLELDHIVPLSQGGAHDIENAVPACKSCNSRKQDKSLLRWMYDNNHS